MPRKDLQAAALAVDACDELGHADQLDLVRAALDSFGIEHDDFRDQRIADELFDDAGEQYKTSTDIAGLVWALAGEEQS